MNPMILARYYSEDLTMLVRAGALASKCAMSECLRAPFVKGCRAQNDNSTNTDV
jgi:hypothetical protein